MAKINAVQVSNVVEFNPIARSITLKNLLGEQLFDVLIKDDSLKKLYNELITDGETRIIDKNELFDIFDELFEYLKANNDYDKMFKLLYQMSSLLITDDSAVNDRFIYGIFQNIQIMLDETTYFENEFSRMAYYKSLTLFLSSILTFKNYKNFNSLDKLFRKFLNKTVYTIYMESLLHFEELAKSYFKNLSKYDNKSKSKIFIDSMIRFYQEIGNETSEKEWELQKEKTSKVITESDIPDIVKNKIPLGFGEKDFTRLTKNRKILKTLFGSEIFSIIVDNFSDEYFEFLREGNIYAMERLVVNFAEKHHDNVLSINVLYIGLKYFCKSPVQDNDLLEGLFDSFHTNLNNYFYSVKDGDIFVLFDTLFWYVDMLENLGKLGLQSANPFIDKWEINIDESFHKLLGLANSDLSIGKFIKLYNLVEKLIGFYILADDKDFLIKYGNLKKILLFKLSEYTDGEKLLISRTVGINDF